MDRQTLIAQALEGEPAYRVKQAQAALFKAGWHSWADATTLSKGLREKLKDVPWSVVFLEKITETRDGTKKALLRLWDGHAIECVLLPNAREAHTICISSQVGCAMKCRFCATGSMGIVRSLSMDEIVDQYRFWAEYLEKNDQTRDRITNLVYMGMGEPMANYEAVRDSLRMLLENTEIGPTRMTVSTVGVMAGLRKLVADSTWPAVRVAISLHSAVPETRKDLVKTHQESLYQDLVDWAREYQTRFNARRLYLSFEYVLLGGLNDDKRHAKTLVAYLQKFESPRVNLIPYNSGAWAEFQMTPKETALAFQKILVDSGIPATIRRTTGQEIAAACGQLAVSS